MSQESTRVGIGPNHARSSGQRKALGASTLIIALIPAYNEERFIGSLVLTARHYVDHVVVVDDGSRDRTSEIARRAGATVIGHLVNQGKAAAVNTGFNYARYLGAMAVVMLDGDGQHYAEDIPTVLGPILTGSADIVIGSRFLDVKSDIPAYRQVGQHGLTVATNLASGVWVGDSQSGFRAFSAHALEHLAFQQNGFSLESEMQFLASDYRFRVVEVPIKVIYAESAKRNPITHGMQVINGIMRLVGQSRPLLFFGISGIITALSGVLLGLFVVNIYARNGVLAVGYALLTVLFVVIGVTLLFAGVILHSIRGMLLDVRNGVINRISGVQDHDEIEIANRDRTLFEIRSPAEPPPESLAREVGD